MADGSGQRHLNEKSGQGGEIRERERGIEVIVFKKSHQSLFLDQNDVKLDLLEKII